jgi:hypothetical protein
LRHLAWAADAALARARGQHRRARTLLRRAARESERLAARILDEQWRATFWGDWGWAHEALADLELRHGEVEAGFEALERGRGRALLGTTTGAATSAVGNEVRSWAASRMARDRDRTTRSAAGPEPQRFAERSPVAVRRARAAVPPSSIGATALRARLPADALLLDFALHRGVLDAFVVRPDRLEAARGLATERRLRQLEHALLFGLRSAALTEPGQRAHDPGLAATLEEIASLVLWPALRRAGGLPSSLAIVPVGPLARVPWAALPLADGRALCEATTLTVVPGLRLGLARDGAALGRGAPLIVASDAGELERVSEETAAVHAAFPEALRLEGEAANAGRFLELAHEAPWIHFAGHGVYRADSPLHSGLRLADRWVTAGELTHRRLRGRWITLSACQTARALVRPGEEWFGLARALLLAGARAVVAPQWDIEDAVAADFMADLYRRLASGAALSEALAQAQRARIAQGRHPLEWAGFVLLAGPDSGRPGGSEISVRRRGPLD